MILLVDVGNTNLKWAIVRNHIIAEQESIMHRHRELKLLFWQIWSEIKEIQTVWISNVAGDLMRVSLTQWIEQYWQITPFFAHSTAQAYDVTSAYQHPEQLGIDRWLALIGAHRLIKGNVCIADCGTAITVDLLSATGTHLGGMIAPGIAAMQNTLFTETSALTQLANTTENYTTLEFEAKNTTQGIWSGIHYMVIGFLIHLLSEIEKKYQQTFILVITGGDAPTLQPFLPKTHQHIPDLVLQGLKAMADKHP